MFESFIISLREGIEVALIIGLIWVYLRKTDRPQLIPAVLWGLAAGVGISVLLAVGIQQLDLSGAIVEGTMMFVAAAFVGTMVIWMMSQARSVGKQIRDRVEKAASRPTSAGAAWGLAAFTAVMVAREGFETVVFLATIWKGRDAGELGMMLAYLGVAAGLGLAAAFAVAFIRGSVHIDLARFFRITGILLMIFIVQVLAYGMHEYDEAGLMNWMPDSAMSVIHQIAANNVLFILAIVAIPVLMLLIPGGRQQSAGPRARLYRVGGAVAGFAVLAALGGQYISTRVQAAGAEHPVLHPESGQVELYLTQLTPGEPTRFAIAEDGGMLPLIALLDASGELHLATASELEPGDRFELRPDGLVRIEADGEVYELPAVAYELEEEKEAYIDVEAIEELAGHH
ncbi:MAG: FTR1 family protein [Phycisphaeraceae bacterium]